MEPNNVVNETPVGDSMFNSDQQTALIEPVEVVDNNPPVEDDYTEKVLNSYRFSRLTLAIMLIINVAAYCFLVVWTIMILIITMIVGFATAGSSKAEDAGNTLYWVAPVSIVMMVGIVCFVLGLVDVTFVGMWILEKILEPEDFKKVAIFCDDCWKVLEVVTQCMNACS